MLRESDEGETTETPTLRVLQFLPCLKSLVPLNAMGSTENILCSNARADATNFKFVLTIVAMRCRLEECPIAIGTRT